MSLSDTYFRHQCIIRRLEKAPANQQEIREYYELECETHGYNFIFSNRTFIRDKQEILSLHKKDIAYNSATRKYFLEEDDVPDDFGNRIADAYNTYLALNLADGTADYIHLEKRRPQGMEHFHDLLNALRNKLVIQFSYEKYYDDNISERRVEPMALKEFKSRWYLVSRDTKDNVIKTFALDRISALELTKQKFKLDKNFKMAEHFKYCFGIIRPSHSDVKPEKIVLALSAKNGKYIKSLPLHESQRTILDNKEETQIELELYITRDFIMELLSYGKDLKVLAPLHLKETINRIFSEAAE